LRRTMLDCFAEYQHILIDIKDLVASLWRGHRRYTASQNMHIETLFVSVD
jgi:hypothetical protein